jgi:2-iminobutanoate/2-iminopropanoate deaminase
MAYEKNIVSTDKAPGAVGTYSQGVIHNGVIYFSGQIGLCPEKGEMKEGFENQIEQIMKNIDGLLESQNIDRTHIIKTSIFITDLNNFGLVNKAYENYFAQPYPARSCVEVPRLPKDALVEIEVIAVTGA